MSATICLSCESLRPALPSTISAAIVVAWARAMLGARFTRVAVRHAEHRHHVDARAGCPPKSMSSVEQPRIRRHDRLRGDRARILHVAHVPEVGILAALAREIRADAARAPQERMVVDELAGLRVLAVALGLVRGTAGSSASGSCKQPSRDVDVAPRELERRVRLHRRDRRHVRADEERRNDLEQRGDDHGDRRPAP